MPVETIAGVAVNLDAEGFMTDSSQWNRDIAAELARRSGITSLTDRHRKVIDFCRKDAKDQGEPPGVRRITKMSGVDMKEIYALFPKGPGKLASLVSGLPKPKGCI